MRLYNPWRDAEKRPEITIDCRHELPDGQSGAYDSSAETIYLCKTLLQSDRRCTLAHELLHVDRGAPPVDVEWIAEKEERIVDRLAAQRLIDRERFIDAVIWCGRRVGPECASELWVDIDTLCTWVRTLTAREIREIQDRIEQRLSPDS